MKTQKLKWSMMPWLGRDAIWFGEYGQWLVGIWLTNETPRMWNAEILKDKKPYGARTLPTPFLDDRKKTAEKEAEQWFLECMQGENNAN